MINKTEGDPLEIRKLFENDSHRPGYHYLPPDGQLQDIDGTLYWRGAYHMTYLTHPIFPGGPAYWAHASTKDLIHWQDHPFAISPEPGSYDEYGIWSGGAIDANGVATIAYTGKTNPETYETHPDIKTEVQCIATSTDDDLIHWTKNPGNPVITEPPKNLDVTAFRDPCLWRENDGWGMLIGSGIRGLGGSVLLYKSSNMEEWQFIGEMFSDNSGSTGWAWEVPDFFQIGNKWILLVSPILREVDNGSIYYIGEYDGRKFKPERSGILDSGWLYRAPETFWAPDGRRLTFAWLFEGRSWEARVRAGWTGTTSIPRELSLHNDNSLRITPISELQSLRGNHCKIRKILLDTDSQVWHSTINSPQVEIYVEINRGNANSIKLNILCSPDNAEITSVIYNWSTAQLSLDTTNSSTNNSDDLLKEIQVAGIGSARSLAAALTEPPFSLGNGESLRLHVFVDRSIVEVFANERSCLTSRVYPTRSDSIGVSMQAIGGSAMIESLDVWNLKSIW